MIISLLLESGTSLLDEDSMITISLLELSSLEEDSTIMTSLLELSSLEEDSSLDELGSIMLLEDGVSLLLETGFELEEDTTELEEATLELLFTEELLGTSELEEGTALLLETGFELEEDTTELEEATLLEERSTVILPAAEVLLSIPVTAIV
jgi:hypothetical protein